MALPDFIDGLIQTSGGTLQRLSRNELLPEALKDPVFSVKDEATGEPLPVVLKVGKLEQSSRPHAQVMKYGDNKFIVTDEAYHYWTKGYVERHLTHTDEQLNKSTHPLDNAQFYQYLQRGGNTNQWEVQEDTSAKLERYERLVQYMRESSKKRGVDNLNIRLTYNNMFVGKQSTASVEVTAEGKPYLLIGIPTFLKALSSDVHEKSLKAVIDHEIAHLVNGDCLPENLARAHNNPGLQRLSELRADLSTHDPEALGGFFKEILASAISKHTAYWQQVPSQQLLSRLTPDDIRSWSARLANQDTAHPALYERIAAAEVKSALTFAYDSRYPHADSGARDAWVNGKIMEQYQKGELPDPVSLKSIEVLSSPSRVIPKGVMSLPMEETTIAPSQAVPAAEPTGQRQR